MRNRLPIIAALAAVLALPSPGHADSDTLAAVVERGYLKCAVRAGHVGFASPDVYGEWRGFDADFCRAVAAAVLGDARLVMFISSDRDVGIDSLASGSADVVARALLELGALGGEGARSVGVLLHDSYGFLVPAAAGIGSADELAGKKICVPDVNGAPRALRELAGGAPAGARLAVAPTLREVRLRYQRGECPAIGGLRSDLAGIRVRLDDPDAHRILPDEIGKAPAGPRVRGDDPRWASVVEWVLFALIEAEELGLTSDSVDAVRADPPSHRVAQFLGTEGELGSMLGLHRDWAYRVVKEIGSYAEMYDRSLGPGTPLDLERTRSRLWSRGGMLFAPPVVAR